MYKKETIEMYKSIIVENLSILNKNFSENGIVYLKVEKVDEEKFNFNATFTCVDLNVNYTLRSLKGKLTDIKIIIKEAIEINKEFISVINLKETFDIIEIEIKIIGELKDLFSSSK